MTPDSAPSATVGAFWTRTPEALCSALACGTQGLETPDPARRLSKYGRNSLRRGPPEATAKPQVWDLKSLIRFAAIMGPMSSIFDFLTFGALLFVFRVSPAEFRTTWFLKTMITQILVIFIIRTNGRPWRNRPSPALAASSLVALVAAMALPFTPAGAWFGFQAPPPATLAGIGILVVVYLVSAELLKPWAIGGSRETRSVGPEGGSPAAGEAILSHAAGRSGT